MNFIFKHFGKLWLIAFVVSMAIGLAAVALIGWASIKLVNHFTTVSMVVDTIPHLT